MPGETHDHDHAHDHPPGAGHAHDHDHGHDHPHDHSGHDHGHGGHDDHGGHGHHHHHGPVERRGLKTRFAIAIFFVVIALLGATGFMVRAGTAMVVTRFGQPVRVLAEPGLGWKWPAPVERTVEVDCRLQTTASGSHGVLTKDGLSVVVQAAATWQVPADERSIVQFLRAVRNQPTEAANQLRTFLGSSLETVTSRFELASLVNIDAAKVRLPEFEAALKERLEKQVLEAYGVKIVKVGVVRLMLPESTVSATTARMSAERDTVAEERKAYGRKAAGEIRSGAEKDARITRAKAEEEASVIVAEARKQAAAIYGKVQALDPQLYTFLRSLDTLETIINPGTRLVLRTDAAPFNALVEGPPLAAPAAAKPDKPATAPGAP